MSSFRSAGLLLFLTLILAFGLARAESRDPLPVPDLPGYRTLKCDFHLHSVFSDGEVWPPTRVWEAWRDGLDVIALTDHAGYNPHEQDLPPNLKRPYELSKPVADSLGIILVPGVEIAEGNIHDNALFVSDPNAMMGLGLLAALREASRQGAVAFWNHPGWKSVPQWWELVAAAHKEHLFAGLELVNGATVYPETFPWVGDKGLTIFANSDVHAPIAAEYAARGRPVTLVFAATADAQGVKDALLAGRSAAWMNGQLWGPERHLRGLWQQAVRAENTKLVWRRGEPGPWLMFRNSSAIPFQIRVKKTVSWLHIGSSELRAEGAAGLAVHADRQAPSGTQNVTIELEITNLHVAPEENLVVELPLIVEEAQ